MNITSAQTSSPLQYSHAPNAEAAKPTPEALEVSANSAVARPEGVRVTLSAEGREKASSSREANPSKDIEESGLPDQAQKILKMIREIQQKIDEKQEELQALMNDQSISQEVKQARAGALQSTLATLSASLISANNSLDKLSKNGTISAAQSQQATQLMMKK
ncbi:hypothetical protein [Pseudomonas qingdaonensis]|uniref:hypothetical protein n=1 Tax=Pseudomonas qingdaonensis TaxID=2056231 RepID=UPI0028ACC67B|nr:hypothetical protein [Pseudomonas qingdaonensis]